MNEIDTVIRLLKARGLKYEVTEKDIYRHEYDGTVTKDRIYTLCNVYVPTKENWIMDIFFEMPLSIYEEGPGYRVHCNDGITLVCRYDRLDEAIKFASKRNRVTVETDEGTIDVDESDIMAPPTASERKMLLLLEEAEYESRRSSWFKDDRREYKGFSHFLSRLINRAYELGRRDG